MVVLNYLITTRVSFVGKAMASIHFNTYSTVTSMKVRKTQECGLNCVLFFNFFEVFKHWLMSSESDTEFDSSG